MDKSIGIIQKHMSKKHESTTPCKNNCLVLAYLENPADFPQARSMFTILGA